MYTFLKTGAKIIPIEKVSIFHSPFFWISIAEFSVILFLIYKLKSKKTINELSDFEIKNIKSSKNNSIDMNNLMNSIHNSKGLYKELSKKCHPDRFINDPRQKLAEEIFQEITKNERNYEKLSTLKLRAENELNINF